MTHTHDTLMALFAKTGPINETGDFETALAELIAERDALTNNLANATNILQSVLNGRTSPQLAQEVVNALNDVLDEARGLKGTPT